MVADMVSSLCVFVFKNLGTYCSGNMLMYATGTNAQPTSLYRWLRDHRLKGITDREDGEARRESKPELAVAATVAVPGPGGLAVVQVPRGKPHVDRGLLRALGVSRGASEGSSSGRSQLVSSLSERFELSFSLVGLSKSSAVANLVIGAAVDNNLPIYESMERAVAQYEAVGGDHLALRREFIKLVAESATRPLQTEPEEKFKSTHRERTETDGSEEEGPEEECELGRESWKLADEGDVEIDLDKYEDEIDYCKGMLEEESGRDMGGPCPIPSLGEISKMWDHFSILGEAVMLAPKYKYLDPDRAAKSKNSLWKFFVLSRFLPVTIPVYKPSHEIFFAEDLVRSAIPGIQQSGRSLAVAGLHVSFGAPLEATDTATLSQPQRMVHLFRQEREDPPASLTESEAEVRNKIQEMKILGAEEANQEIKIQKVNAKKRKVISYRI
jgi:hypothetical protein